VHFEACGDIWAAIAREKQIKSWSRKKKIALIESVNGQWNALSAARNGDQGATAGT